MIRAALEAFDRLDPAAAAVVIQQDQEMDSEYAAALRRMLTRAMEDARQVQAAIEAAFIMRSLERIGDHARNIARHVGFIGGQISIRRATGVSADVALHQELTRTASTSLSARPASGFGAHWSHPIAGVVLPAAARASQTHGAHSIQGECDEYVATY